MSHPKLKNFRRIVVKVGSSLLIDSAAGEVRASWLAALAADIAKLHRDGKDVLHGEGDHTPVDTDHDPALLRG